MDLPDPAHRPWPLPRRPWALAMQWLDLLFMHWPVPAAALRPHVPPALTLDRFDGAAWLGVVPFRMAGIRPHGLPAVPGLSAFPELNVRTYVVHDGKPGVWFFSLDAAQRLAVRLARWTYHLPYFDAAMRVDARGDAVHYASRRTHRGSPPVAFHARYRPTGPAAEPDDLGAFLTERYALYAGDGRRLWRGDVHHRRWPLQPAEAEVPTNTMTHALGIDLPDRPPLLHFARRLDVVAWTARRVA